MLATLVLLATVLVALLFVSRGLPRGDSRNEMKALGPGASSRTEPDGDSRAKGDKGLRVQIDDSPPQQTQAEDTKENSALDLVVLLEARGKVVGAGIEVRVELESEDGTLVRASGVSNSTGRALVRIEREPIEELQGRIEAVFDAVSAEAGSGRLILILSPEDLAGSRFSVTLTLSPVCTIRGRALLADGSPARGAVVEALSSNEYGDGIGRSPLATGSASGDGGFEIRCRFVGELAVVVRAHSAGAACTMLVIDSGPSVVDVGTLVLRGAQNFGATVVAAHGAPMPRINFLAAVDLDSAALIDPTSAQDMRPSLDSCEGLRVGIGTTDDLGQLTIEGLGVGEIRLNQSTDPMLGQPMGTFSGGLGHLVELPSFPFRVAVVDAEGRPAPGLRVQVRTLAERGDDTAASDPQRTFTTDAKGIALVPWDAPGHVRVSVISGDSAQTSAEFAVPAGGCATIPTLHMQLGRTLGDARLRVAIRSSRGGDLSGLRVGISRVDVASAPQYLVLDAEPDLLVDGLEPGLYEVNLRAKYATETSLLQVDGSETVHKRLSSQETTHVEFLLRAGARLRVFRDRSREGDLTKMSVWMGPAGGTLRGPLWMYAPVAGGAVLDDVITPDRWWTSEEVFPPGSYRIELRHGREVVDQTQIGLQSGAYAEWRSMP